MPTKPAKARRSRPPRPARNAPPGPTPPAETSARLTNLEIADRLRSLAQLLSAQRENPFKIKAYRRAAETIAQLPESVDELVRHEADLTAYAGIGKGIASALREIVESGTLRKLDALRADVPPEVAALTEHPRLDPKRVLQAYKKLNISSVAELKEKLARGEVGRALGPRLEQHFRSALVAAHEILLYDAHEVVAATQRFLLERCGAMRAEPAGDYRRRVEVIGELTFVIETDDFARAVEKLKHYGGHAELLAADSKRATFKLSSGILLTVESPPPGAWGLAMITATGSEAHLAKLPAAMFQPSAATRPPRGSKPLRQARNANRGRTVQSPTRTSATTSRSVKSTQPPSTTKRGRWAAASSPTPPASINEEAAIYREFGLAYIPPELREGRDEVTLAQHDLLPALVAVSDIRGDLHAHTTSSDGAHTIEQMAAAARERGYAYLGITDHSQSLKIAGGVSEDDLWRQIRAIDRLNAKLTGFRILKSAEVDIRVDGTLDYPDELLRELDYTVCSIHSRFGLGRKEQTERVLRAMDNPHFAILGHATGRLLLRRPGYDLDIERIIAHAKHRGCWFEINSSPDRLDLRAEHARLVREAGVRIAICTDAHSIRELEYISAGVEQARRAGLSKDDVLNCQSWPVLERLLAARRR